MGKTRRFARLTKRRSFVDFSSTGDLNHVVKHVNSRYPRAPLYLVGFSMGSIQSLMWLAQQKGKLENPVKGFVGISCPVSLGKAVAHMSHWQNLLYANNMTKAMLKIADAHSELVADQKIDVDYGSRDSRSGAPQVLQTRLLRRTVQQTRPEARLDPRPLHQSRLPPVLQRCRRADALDPLQRRPHLRVSIADADWTGTPGKTSRPTPTSSQQSRREVRTATSSHTLTGSAGSGGPCRTS